MRRQVSPGTELIDHARKNIAEEQDTLAKALELLDSLLRPRIELAPQLADSPPLPPPEGLFLLTDLFFELGLAELLHAVRKK